MVIIKKKEKAHKKNILAVYKTKGRIIAYIKKEAEGDSTRYVACTGKPSDSMCVSWGYENGSEAAFTAAEYAAKTARGARNVTVAVYKEAQAALVEGINQYLYKNEEEGIEL